MTDSAMDKVNLTRKFSLFSETWRQGEFVWHHHETEDELFYVVKGALTIRLRDGEIHLREGELVVIPRGVEHQPVADEELDRL